MDGCRCGEEIMIEINISSTGPRFALSKFFF